MSIIEYESRRTDFIQGFIGIDNAAIPVRSYDEQGQQNNIPELGKAISPEWFRFVYFDERSTTLKPREGYRHWDILQRRFKVKLNKHGKRNYREAALAV